jgi:hypothetical protein
MFFELRQYWMFPGKRDEYVRFMEELIIPGQQAMGIDIIGSFIGQEDDNLYVWIRRFESEDQLNAFNTAYYETDEWKNTLLPKARELNDFSRMLVTRIEATPASLIQ